MRALLDINVLIALLDADHLHHVRARRWIVENAAAGWASCALTENGCIRIMSQTGYPNPMPASSVIERLARATRQPVHAFWPADISILDPDVIDHSRIHGPRQLTDVYLLALAFRNQGRFVSFDRSVPVSAVRGATSRHLLVI